MWQLPRTCRAGARATGWWRHIASDWRRSLNLGTDPLFSITEVMDIISRVAWKRIRKRYDLTKPQGVRGRNSDNTRLRQVLGWEPQTPLEEGLRITYEWIRGELIRTGRLESAQAGGGRGSG